MGARVFIRLATERAIMYHHDEASLDLEVSVPGVDLGAGGHLISRGSRVLTKSLLGVSQRS
jgi:hypothetical protein